eukprot:968007-Amphidinium_carterae.2
MFVCLYPGLVRSWMFVCPIGVTAEGFLRRMPTPPQDARIQLAQNRLEELGALIPAERPGLSGGQGPQLRPSAFGKLLQELPFDASIGSLIMNGVRYGVLQECALLAAVHRSNPLDSFQDHPDFTQQLARQFNEVCRELLAHAGDLQSDLVIGLYAYKAWQNKIKEEGEGWAAKQGPEWCEAHFLSFSRLLEVEEFYVQVRDALEKLDDHEGLDSDLRQKLRKRRKAAWHQGNWRLNIRNPAADFRHLLRAHFVESERERNSLLAWCLCASFPHGLVEVFGGKHSSTVWYLVEPERTNKLCPYLQALGLDSTVRPVMRKFGDMCNCVVDFPSSSDAQQALKIGGLEKERDCPYRKVEQPKNERARMKLCARVCFRNHECMVGSDSAVWPLRRDKVTLITSEVLPVRTKEKNKLLYIFSKNTIVPDGILLPVLLATYPMLEAQKQAFEVRFHGQWERFSITDFEQTLPVQARRIRQNLDEEFKPGTPESQRRQIVEERRSIVCDIMRQLRDRKALVTTREDVPDQHVPFLSDVNFLKMFP